MIVEVIPVPVRRWASTSNSSCRLTVTFLSHFYARDYSTQIDKFDVNTGALTQTNLTPFEVHTSMEVNPNTGDIYIGPYMPTGTTFQLDSTTNNTLTTLAPLPQSLTNHSTLAWVQ